MNKLNLVKKIVCVALLLISIYYAKAGSCAANGNGNWETPGIWSCGHIPGAGDNVTLGAGITVTVTANNGSLIGNLNIFGTLKFTNGSKINLSASSVVNIFSGGSITGGNSGAKLVFPTSAYSGPFSTTGPFYFSNNSSGVGLLPLTLVSFYSSQQNQDIILYWRTENEENISSFQIELSGDGNADWQLIESIPSMAANEDGYSYSYIDHTILKGDRYYRLKIIDRDGQYAYSKILFIASGQTATVSVTPTLVSGSISISLTAAGTTSISIYNTRGQLVKTLTTGNEVFNMDVSGLPRGEYFLQIFQGKNAYVSKFLKQ